MKKSKYETIIGEVYHKITVLEVYIRKNGRGRGRTFVLGQCACGNIKEYNFYTLKSGHTKSCGCYKGTYIKIAKTIYREYRVKLYNVWAHMKRRCYDINDSRYKNYGDRGITVCDEWLEDFRNFYSWAIENGYKEGLSIDRIDNNGNYEPENCRFVTMKTQQNNRSNNIILEINRITKTLSEWCDYYNISYDLVNDRLRRKWSIDRLFNEIEKSYKNRSGTVPINVSDI